MQEYARIPYVYTNILTIYECNAMRDAIHMQMMCNVYRKMVKKMMVKDGA